MNLRNNLFIAVALLNIAGLSQAMADKEILVKLPPALTIRQRLGGLGLEHFLEKTEIDKQLGNTSKYPLGVAMAVELSLSDYDAYLKNPMMNAMMQMHKPDIIKAILKDSPEAIAELEKVGLLEQAKK